MENKYKAPSWFVKLFKEGMFESKKIEKYVTGIVGYGHHWCKQNPKKVDEMLSNEQKDVINEIADRIEVIKNYAWSRYFYENWKLVKNSMASPLSNASYDGKKEVIIIDEPGIFKKAIHKANGILARKMLQKKIREIAKRKLDNKPKAIR